MKTRHHRRVLPVRRRFLDWLIRGVPRYPIPNEDGEPYLDRYIVTKFGVRFFVHHYHSPDKEPWLHDHPWWAIGIPIIGGYTEERLVRLCPIRGMVTRYRKIRPFRPNLILTNRFHRIASAKPGTWTLFFHGKRTGAFGFLEQKWVYGKSVEPNRYEIRYHQPKDFVLEYSRNLMETADG